MHRIKALVLDQYFRQNFIFFLGSMMAAFFNYLFHPILGRMLGVEEFGEVQFFLSFYGQFAVLVTVFSIVAINIFANNPKIENGITKLQELKNIFIYAFVILFAILIMISFKTSSGILNMPVLVFCLLLLLLGLFTNYRTAYLQARKKFFSLSSISLVNSVVKLLLALALVTIGLSTYGAIMGIILAQVFVLSLAYKFTKKDIAPSFNFSLSFGKNVTTELLYGFIIFVSMGAVVFFSTADIIFMKYFFSDYDAGAYSGVATIARIIYFIAGSLTGVLLASIKLNESKTVNLKALAKSFTFLCLLVLPVLLLFNIFPEEIIVLLIGEKYQLFASLLPRISFLMAIVSCLNLLVAYNIALRRKMLVLASLLPGLITIILIFLFHTNPASIINSLTFGALLMCVLLLINEKRDFHNHSRI